MPDEKIEEVSMEVSAKLGQDLIREALTQFRKNQQDRVIGEVHAIMERLSVMNSLKTKTEKRIVFLKEQMEAINKGEFEVVETGYGRPGIKFNKVDLNLDWSYTESW